MPRVYRPRHPERTILYHVLFHYFDRFLTEYESRFEKDYGFFRPIIKEVVERYLDCGNPRCGFCPSCHAKRIVDADLRPIPAKGWAVVDRIINHLKLTFVADKPPPPHIAHQELLMAAGPAGEYLS